MWFANANVVDTLTGETHRGAAIETAPDGTIAQIGARAPADAYDIGGRWLLPGTGPAAVTTAGGDLAVAVIGTDHHIWLFSPTATQVYGWLDFGGRTSSTPGIANDSPRRDIQVQFIVFARGTDNALWSNYSGLAIGTPGGWTSLGGSLTSGPSAATVPTGATYVFALGTDNLPWMRSGIWPSLDPWTRA